MLSNQTAATDNQNASGSDATTVIEQTRLAIDQGRYADALLALQRIVALNPDLLNDPDFLRQIGLLYRSAGHPAPEFLHPPQSAAPPSCWASLAPKGWVAISSGHDTNINSASNLVSLTIPRTNQIIPIENPLLIQKKSLFAGLSGGLDLRYALSPQTRALFYGQVQSRYHFSENAYIPHNYYGAAALQHSFQSAEFTAGIAQTRQLVALHNLFESNSLTAQASYYMRPGISVTLGSELKKSRYPTFSPASINGKLWRLGAMSLDDGVVIDYVTGREDTGGKAIELDKSYSGLMGAWNIPMDKNQLNLYLAISRTNYANLSPAFLIKRMDRNLTMVAEYRYKLNGKWQDWYINSRLIGEKNDSNIALSSYSRQQLMLELLREF